MSDTRRTGKCVAEADIEGAIKKKQPALAERLAVAERFVSEGNKVTQVIWFASIASSTWHSQKSKSTQDGRSKNKGRPKPGYTINPDGLIIPDNTIQRVYAIS